MLALLLAEEQQLAFEKLAHAPFHKNIVSNDYVSPEEIGFLPRQRALGMYRVNRNVWSLAEIPLDHLVCSQDWIPREGIHAYIENLQLNPTLPEVVMFEDFYIVQDGHTRLAAQMLAGRTSSRVKLFAEIEKR